MQFINRTLLSVAAIPALSLAAQSAPLSLICENQRREYQVVYDPAYNSVHADETQHRVLAVEETPERMVVVGLTVDDGPTFRLHIRPYKKMEFYAGSQLTQIEGCR